jgi:hypothetical protein
VKGVEFVVDEKGKKKAVVLDLKTQRSVWEDFCDVLRAKEREDGPRESIDSVKKKVLKRAWMPGYTITFARSAKLSGSCVLRRPASQHSSIPASLFNFWPRTCLYRQGALDWVPIFEKIDRLKNKIIMGCCNAFMADYPTAVRVRNSTNYVIQFPILTSA